MRPSGSDSLANLLRARMRAQADLFAALTTHPTLVGSCREDALSELLRQLVPRRFEILSGTVAVLDNDLPVKSTHQFDIIVADTIDYPTLLRLGTVAVVLPPAVRALVEVKSNLGKGKAFCDSMIQCCRTKQALGPGEAPSVFTTLFSFGAPSDPVTLRGWMTQLLELRELLSGADRPAVHALRAEVLGSDAGNADVEAELLSVLSGPNLPDLVVADKGAVALKSDSGYMFVEAVTEPSVVVLMDQLLQHLSSTTDGETPKKALDIMRAHLGLRLEPVGEDLPIPILAPAVSSLD